jgi:flagellar motor switch protein FliG
MKVKGGIKEAARLLSALTAKNRKRVLEIISKEDFAMAQMLEKNMVSLEDLKFLSVKMLQELLREISLQELGTAMRISTIELREFILSNISKSMALELSEILSAPPVPSSKINESSDRVLAVLRRKIETGEIVLKKDGEDPLV